MEKNERTIIEIANEYVTQSNRGTRHPIAFVVSEIKLVPNIDGDGEVITIYEDGDNYNCQNIEEVLDLACSQHDCNREGLKELIPESYVDNPEIYHDEIFECLFPDATIFSEDKERVKLANTFFMTKTGYDDHIRINGHHYTEPQSYLIYLGHRNSEILQLANLLYGIATVPREQWNKEARRYYESEVLKEKKEIF